MKYFAIEIRSNTDVELVAALDPTIRELDFEKDLRWNFFVIGFPTPGKFALIPANRLSPKFHHIESAIHVSPIKFLVEE